MKVNNTWIVNTTEVFYFYFAIISGHIMPGDVDRDPNNPNHKLRNVHRRTVLMQCFPLYSILLALDNPTVDYFSLDIEGAEYPVLKTIPFDKVDIKMMGIEFVHMGKVFDGSPEEVADFLQEKG